MRLRMYIWYQFFKVPGIPARAGRPRVIYVSLCIAFRGGKMRVCTYAAERGDLKIRFVASRLISST